LFRTAHQPLRFGQARRALVRLEGIVPATPERSEDPSPRGDATAVQRCQFLRAAWWRYLDNGDDVLPRHKCAMTKPRTKCMQPSEVNMPNLR
jgi:hypothetical protein